MRNQEELQQTLSHCSALVEIDEEKTAKQLWYTAYTEFVRIVYGYVGRKHRIPLPVCVEKDIRDAYPEASGEYVVFKTERTDDNDDVVNDDDPDKP